MFSAVLDTSVYVAGLISPSGAPAELMRALVDGEFDVVVSAQLIEELGAVLSRPAIAQHVAPAIAEQFIEWLTRIAIFAEDAAKPDSVCADPADDFIVALARNAHARFIVSGDSHLLDLKEPRPPVLTPRELVTLLEGLR